MDTSRAYRQMIYQTVYWSMYDLGSKSKIVRFERREEGVGEERD